MSYKFPATDTEKLELSDHLTYIVERNLYTWTDWVGWDPESSQAQRFVRRSGSSCTPETLNDMLGFQAYLIGLYQDLSTYYSRNGDQGWPIVWQSSTGILWLTYPKI